MRLVEILEVTGVMVTAAATLLAGAEKAVVKRLRRRGATSAEDAIDPPRLRSLTRWHLARLIDRRAVVVGEDGRVHLDETTYAPLRTRRRLVGIILVAVVFAVVVAIYGIFH